MTALTGEVACYMTKERKVELDGNFRVNSTGTTSSIEFVQSDIRVLLGMKRGRKDVLYANIKY